MLLLVAPAVTKKKLALKNVSSRTVMILVNGIQRTSVLSCGIFSTVVKNRVSTFVYSQLVTGLKWMCGIISGKKISQFLHYTLPTKERQYIEITHGCLFLNFCHCAKVKLFKRN